MVALPFKGVQPGISLPTVGGTPCGLSPSQGMPARTNVTVKAFSSVQQARIKVWLRDVIAKVAAKSPWLASSMRLSTRIVLCQPPLVKSQLFSAPSAIRNFKLEPHHCDSHEIAAALSGIDMLRIPLSSKRPAGETDGSQSRLQARECFAWLRLWKVSNDFSPVPYFASGSSRRLTPCREVPCSASLDSRIFEEAKALLGQSSGEYQGTVADTDPSVVWLQRTDYAVTRILNQMRRSGGRWSVMVANVPAIVAWYRRVIDLVLPPQVGPRVSAFSAKNLPYAYATIKDKCWQFCGTSVKHCCSDPSHSCLRVICSFYNVTIRKQLKYVSRAVRFLLRASWETFELWDLAQAPRIIDTNLAKLKLHSKSVSNPNGCSIMCSSPMRVPGVLVGDAGQAYETPDVRKIIKAVD